MRRAWWKDGLELNLRIRPAGIALAFLYAIACWGARKLSLDQFYLPAGIRVAALLLCPFRLWPYLFLGEYSYFAQMRYPLMERYGLAWVILGSLFQMPAVALIVWFHRRMMSVTTSAWLIAVAAWSAILVSVINLSLSHLLWTVPDEPFLSGVARYAVGDFIGVMTIAPVALLWTTRRAKTEESVRSLKQPLIALGLMTLVGVWAALIPPGSIISKPSLQVVMALPAIALTCTMGWRGAALAVPAMNLIIGLTTPKPFPSAFDSATFATQQSMAVISIALLALGSTISYYRVQFRARDLNEKAAFQLARTTHLSSEMELRERAMHLKKISDWVDDSLDEVVDWLKLQGHHDVADGLLNTATVHSRLFRAQVSMVYPTALDQLGLYVALQAGGAREAWDLSNRVARPKLEGDPCQLSKDLQLAAYRTMIEAVSLLLKHETGQLRIHARCGRFRQRRGVVVAVSLLDKDRRLSNATVALATERLYGRARAYGGILQCRGNRVVIAMMEAPTNNSRWHEAPLQEVSAP